MDASESTGILANKLNCIPMLRRQEISQAVTFKESHNEVLIVVAARLADVAVGCKVPRLDSYDYSDKEYFSSAGIVHTTIAITSITFTFISTTVTATQLSDTTVLRMNFEGSIIKTNW